MFQARWAITILAACLMSYTGCGGAEDGRVPVEGLVTLDGKPLTGVQVLFDQPDLSPNENKGYKGKTDEQGRYALSPVMEEGTGAPPGDYRISLTTAVADPSAPVAAPTKPTGPFGAESPPPLPPERIPPAYRGGKLKFTVPDDGTEQANFDLKSH